MNNCCKLGTQKQEALLKSILTISQEKNWTIIRVLQEAQKIYGYLPRSVVEEIAKILNKPLTEVYSVITFYAEFSLEPKGKYPISVCLGTACYVNGAQQVFDKICLLLGIKEGECTQDGKFSIDQTRCVGCCGMAPVLSIGKEVYGNVKLSDVDKILSKYMER